MLNLINSTHPHTAIYYTHQQQDTSHLQTFHQQQTQEQNLIFLIIYNDKSRSNQNQKSN